MVKKKQSKQEKQMKKDLLLAGCNYRYGCDVDEVAEKLLKMGYVRIEPANNKSDNTKSDNS
jgi:hypothetical protein